MSRVGRSSTNIESHDKLQYLVGYYFYGVVLACRNNYANRRYAQFLQRITGSSGRHSSVERPSVQQASSRLVTAETSLTVPSCRAPFDVRGHCLDDHSDPALR